MISLNKLFLETSIIVIIRIIIYLRLIGQLFQCPREAVFLISKCASRGHQISRPNYSIFIIENFVGKLGKVNYLETSIIVSLLESLNYNH